MKYKLLIFILTLTLLLSGCSRGYNGPYSNTKLLTKDDVIKTIKADNEVIKKSKSSLLKQVQAKQDIKFYQMILSSYEYYEQEIKKVDGKQYVITAESVNNFIKKNKFENNLKQIESNENRWASIFLGNLARYFDNLGFVVYADPRVKQENIVVNW